MGTPVPTRGSSSKPAAAGVAKRVATPAVEFPIPLRARAPSNARTARWYSASWRWTKSWRQISAYGRHGAEGEEGGARAGLERPDGDAAARSTTMLLPPTGRVSRPNTPLVRQGRRRARPSCQRRDDHRPAVNGRAQPAELHAEAEVVNGMRALVCGREPGGPPDLGKVR